MTWSDDVVAHARAALEPLADPVKAAGARRYMKDIAPFLGVPAPARRDALKQTWKDLPTPSSDELGAAAFALFAEPEREFHYAGYDLIGWWRDVADETFLPKFGARLLTSTPWWDSVDGLVTDMVSPLCFRFGHAELIDEWSRSGDRWLIRAAIGHQRGWKRHTDFERVCSLASDHWNDKEFFVAKAIGWALRDCARLNPERIERFVLEHVAPNTVAMREIRKGLATVSRRRRAADRP